MVFLNFIIVFIGILVSLERCYSPRQCPAAAREILKKRNLCTKFVKGVFPDTETPEQHFRTAFLELANDLALIRDPVLKPKLTISVQMYYGTFQAFIMPGPGLTSISDYSNSQALKPDGTVDRAAATSIKAQLTLHFGEEGLDDVIHKALYDMNQTSVDAKNSVVLSSYFNLIVNNFIYDLEPEGKNPYLTPSEFCYKMNPMPPEYMQYDGHYNIH